MISSPPKTMTPQRLRALTRFVGRRGGQQELKKKPLSYRQVLRLWYSGEELPPPPVNRGEIN